MFFYKVRGLSFAELCKEFGGRLRYFGIICGVWWECEKHGSVYKLLRFGTFRVPSGAPWVALGFICNACSLNMRLTYRVLTTI